MEEIVINVVCATTDKTLKDILSEKDTSARILICLLLNVEGYSISEIARILNLSTTRVRHYLFNGELMLDAAKWNKIYDSQFKENYLRCAQAVENIEPQPARLPFEGIIHIDRIVNDVCEVSNVTLEELLSNIRKSELVLARYVAIYLIRKYQPEITLIEIGRYFKRDHATIIYAINRTTYLIKKATRYKDMIQKVENMLAERSAA